MCTELSPVNISVKEGGGGGKKIILRDKVTWNKVTNRRILLVRDERVNKVFLKTQGWIPCQCQ